MLDFDELNRLEQGIRQTVLIGKTRKEVEDWIFDYLVEMLYLAQDSVITDLGGVTVYISSEDIRRYIDEEVGGKTLAQRIDEYAEALTRAEIDPQSALAAEKALQAVAYTEGHRIVNEAIFDNGQANGATYKQWVSMRDNRVRDTHIYLDGTTVPYNADFYSYTGSHGPYPGSFHDPAEDINCRCYIRISRERNEVL